MKTHGWEFYFIRHALDQNRAKDVEHIVLKVYQKDDEGMGSASAELAPTATEAEAKALIEQLAYRATLVHNKPYELNPPRPAADAGRRPSGHDHLPESVRPRPPRPAGHRILPAAAPGYGPPPDGPRHHPGARLAP